MTAAIFEKFAVEIKMKKKQQFHQEMRQSHFVHKVPTHSRTREKHLPIYIALSTGLFPLFENQQFPLSEPVKDEK